MLSRYFSINLCETVEAECYQSVSAKSAVANRLDCREELSLQEVNPAHLGLSRQCRLQHQDS